MELDHVDRKVLDDIARCGWAAISVFATEDDRGDEFGLGQEAFTYTVGMSEHNLPDMIVLGMQQQQAHGVLNAAYEAIQRGVRLEPDTYAAEVLKGLRVGVLEVLEPLGAYPLSMCQHLFGQVEALQIVWPDARDRFPWHDDFDPEYRDRQPLLGVWSGE